MKYTSIIGLALIIAAKCAAAQDSTEYALTVAAKKSVNNSTANSHFSAYTNYRTRNIAQLKGYVPTAIKTDSYGGRADQTVALTGFYHTQKINDRWWIIDPDGHPFFHNALNDVNQGTSDRNKAAARSKYGSNTTWANKTIALLTDNGFNGAGAWSDIADLSKANQHQPKPLAYTVIANFMSGYGEKRGGVYQVPGHKGYPGNAIFVFDPGFKTYCDEHAKQLATYKDDKNLLGYFSDNEMPLGRTNLEGYLSLPQTEPGYIAAKQWIDDHHVDGSKLTNQAKAEFLAYVCDTYFSIVSAAIRKYDPNHMYIGCRFYGAQRFYPEVIKAAGKYADLLSINYYSFWTPKLEDMQNWEKWSGKPFMATEWYVKGEDSGLGNTSGAGWVVKTQAERGMFYQNFVLGLLESKSCVGWHWFKYMDNDPLQKGAEPSNTDANKGIIDNNYDIYQPLLDKMKELNLQMYSLADYFDKRNK